MASPRPKPAAVKRLNGNPGRRPIPPACTEPDGDHGQMPADFTPGQARVWRETVAAAPREVLHTIDREALRSWCIACDLQEQARVALATESPVIVNRFGEKILNPWVKTLQEQARLICRLAEQLGFSPSARSRVHIPPQRGGDEAQAEYQKFLEAQARRRRAS